MNNTNNNIEINDIKTNINDIKTNINDIDKEILKTIVEIFTISKDKYEVKF